MSYFVDEKREKLYKKYHIIKKKGHNIWINMQS